MSIAERIKEVIATVNEHWGVTLENFGYDKLSDDSPEEGVARSTFGATGQL